jgi:YidC/Oxa1 family membrane protein insertase
MKISPKPADKMQARIMMFLPIVFFIFCYNFASALALYWTTQNIFTIGQTLYNNRLPEPVLTKRKTGKKGGKSFLQKMAEAQEAKQREMKSMRQAGSNVTDASKKKKRRGPKTGG